MIAWVPRPLGVNATMKALGHEGVGVIEAVGGRCADSGPGTGW